MKLIINDLYIGLQYEERKRCFSSAVFNGGYTHANLYLNFHVNSNDLKDKKPEILIRESLTKNKFSINSTVALLTAANLKYAQVIFRKYENVVVIGLISAGTSNALNPVDKIPDKDITGTDIEPGTINIIIATNLYLHEECFATTIITATEAKTAALMRLNVKSVYSKSQATGTGTDSIIIISGTGKNTRFAGGHTLFGKMVAEVVYEAVIKSLEKKPINPIIPKHLLRELE